jgi:outer membrane protein OmpA-like peptidoglycan-associated protein
MTTIPIRYTPAIYRHVSRLVLCGFLLAIPAIGLHAQFNYRSFQSVNDVTFNGTARKLDDRIRLVAAEPQQAGSVWFNTKQRVVDGFETTFRFQVGDAGSNAPLAPGADGIAFVLQNSSVYEGSTGEGMGYGTIANSIAVEFDTFDNTHVPYDAPPNGDPDGNHISVQTRGLEANSSHHDYSLGTTSNIPNLKDGAIHSARIHYVPGTLTVYIDDLKTAALTVPLRVEKLLRLDDGRCWIGFTAATGGSWANFDIYAINNEITINIRNILFDYDRATLKEQSFPELQKLVSILKGDPDVQIEVAGHTDNHGGADYNQRLSQQRAESVRNYLVKAGIDGGRVTAMGYGMAQPIATNDTDEGRAENRRVEGRLFKR